MPRLKSDALTVWGAVRIANGEPVASSVSAFRTQAEKWAFKIGNCRVVKIAEVPKSELTEEKKKNLKPAPKAESVRYEEIVQFRGTNGHKNQESPIAPRRRGRPPGSKNRPKVGVWGR